ncbi:MAG: PQQ-binding-like beta-propeller repeat protein [Planctomycetaceae bacterium]|nr:PQQ-binding-like beta-propeller repeat protein [Planctomycetaceae bacterium]
MTIISCKLIFSRFFCCGFLPILILGTVVLAEGPELVDLGKRTEGKDWKTFLGPTGDSKSTETGIKRWPPDGPRLIWKRRLSESYGIGSVSQGRYFQFDYDQGKASLICLESETGKLLWEFEYSSKYVDTYGYNSGPRCSPVIDGHRVYIYGVEGLLHCVDGRNGKPLWKVDTNREFGVVQNFFGVGSTPVIHGDLLIAIVGGSPSEDQSLPPGQLDRVSSNGTGLVAFNKWNGKLQYRSLEELASYAAPRIIRHKGRDWGFAFMRSGLTGFDPQTGKRDFHFPWRAKTLESVNASTPVIVNDQVFISETYGPGSALLSFQPGSYDIVWQDNPRQRQKSMQAHWNTPIYHQGFLYGSSGRHSYNAELRCIDFKTGEIKWSQPGLTRCSLLYVDGHFVCLGENGALRLLKANPERYELVSEATPVIKREEGQAAQPLLKYPAWAAPILAHGLMYVRGSDYVACFELIAK